MPITKIVSGGQTGADSGGIDAAIHCNLPHGGWCPQGRRAENGVISDKYQLQETPSSGYLPRTEANVVDSDTTLIFTIGKLSGGSLKTMEFAQKHKKPVLHINIGEYSRKDTVNFILRWFEGDVTKPTPPSDCVLNVAGQRESKAPGIQDMVKTIMIDVLIKMNPECKEFCPLGEKKEA